MAKYRKKPVVIEAECWIPQESSYGIHELHGQKRLMWDCGVYEDSNSSTGYSIDTLEGKHEVSIGDWIITGIKGEKYPCKPDIFAMTYEKVDD